MTLPIQTVRFHPYAPNCFCAAQLMSVSGCKNCTPGLQRCGKQPPLGNFWDLTQRWGTSAMLSESGASPAQLYGKSWQRESRQTSALFLFLRGAHGHPKSLRWVGLSRAFGSRGFRQLCWFSRALASLGPVCLPGARSKVKWKIGFKKLLQ